MPENTPDTAQPSIFSLDKRLALMEQNHEHLARAMDKVNANLARLVWGVFGAIGLALAKFIFAGGLAP
jgi:hypothetical protein